VVTVRVRDYRAIDRHPRVDVEITGLAVEAAVGSAEKVGHQLLSVPWSGKNS
jgi:hypothetical protein